MDTIKKIATGVVRYEQTEDGLILHRFSKRQTAAFYESLPYYEGEYFNGYFGNNCRTLAGITLNFTTKARRICLRLGNNHIPSDAKSGVFDVYVNGKYRESFPWMPKVDLHFTSGKKHIIIYCPHFNSPAFQAIESDEELVSAGQGVDILLMGDSITHGVGAINPGSSYANTMARELGVRILNQGQSGYVYDAKTVDRVCQPKYIVCAYGTNDRGRKPIEAIEPETVAFFRQVKICYPNVPIAAILPPWIENESERARQIGELFRRIYEDQGIAVIDGQRMIPHDTAYFVDGVHPNNYGGRLYGKRLAKALTSVWGCGKINTIK